MVACIARMISVIIFMTAMMDTLLHNLTSVRYPCRTVISCFPDCSRITTLFDTMEAFTGHLLWWWCRSFNAIDPITDQFQFASLQYLNVMKSYDAGQSFNQAIISNSASPFGGNSAAFIAPFVLAASNSNVIYAGEILCTEAMMADKLLYHPGNQQLDHGNLALSIATSYFNEDSVYICTAPSDSFQMHMLLSTDGGVTLLDRSSDLPNRYPRDLAVDPFDSRIVYVAFSGFGGGHFISDPMQELAGMISALHTLTHSIVLPWIRFIRIHCMQGCDLEFLFPWWWSALGCIQPGTPWRCHHVFWSAIITGRQFFSRIYPWQRNIQSRFK